MGTIPPQQAPSSPGALHVAVVPTPLRDKIGAGWGGGGTWPPHVPAQRASAGLPERSSTATTAILSALLPERGHPPPTHTPSTPSAPTPLPPTLDRAPQLDPHFAGL